DSLVREIEALAHDVQDSAGHELLDAFRRLGAAKLGGTLQQGEIELTADHAGDTSQPARTVAEAIESFRDQVTHAGRHAQVARCRLDLTAAEHPHRFDDHERVALARAPHMLAEPPHSGLVDAGPGESLHEGQRLLLRQWPQRGREKSRLLSELD